LTNNKWHDKIIADYKYLEEFMAIVPIKSKGVAYLLWFFLGIVGAHKFYLEKFGMGILYIITLGFLGIGWLIDLFTLGNQVDLYNALHGGQVGGVAVNNQPNLSQNVVVNVAPPAGAAESVSVKISAEKQILTLSGESSTLSLRQIVSQTSLEIEEAEEAVKKLVAKGMAKEQVDPDGKLFYDFS
jgi:TM2 domain-containing membrane protein YozV